LVCTQAELIAMIYMVMRLAGIVLPSRPCTAQSVRSAVTK
jgi:hypothetical protein